MIRCLLLPLRLKLCKSSLEDSHMQNIPTNELWTISVSQQVVWVRYRPVIVHSGGKMVLLPTLTDDLYFLLPIKDRPGAAWLNRNLLLLTLVQLPSFSRLIRLDFDERLTCFKVSTQDVQTEKTPFCPDHLCFLKLERVNTCIGDLRMQQRVVKGEQIS